MKRQSIILVIFCFMLIGVVSAEAQEIKISKDLELIRLTGNAYLHVSYAVLPEYGRTSANGLVFTNGHEAFLFDTPWNDSLTKDLVTYLRNRMGINIIGFIPNHWHEDCMGGLGYLKSIGIQSWANEKTVEIAKQRMLPVPDKGFGDSITLYLGDKAVYCYYPGAAHSLDNIVVWIPTERILFAGCMVKSMGSAGLGNTVDGDLVSYPGTIEKLLKRYRDAQIVIPGHGETGGYELITHTLDLTR